MKTDQTTINKVADRAKQCRLDFTDEEVATMTGVMNGDASAIHHLNMHYNIPERLLLIGACAYEILHGKPGDVIAA
jgi:hypothetical protein